MELEADLVEIAELSRSGAAERDIETEVVQVFKKAGWPRLQINQDVSVSEKANDRVDIILKLDNRPALLAEIKRYGKTHDAESQVRRYCSLVRPSPRLAFLTDGVRWIVYYVGQVGLIPILDEIAARFSRNCFDAHCCQSEAIAATSGKQVIRLSQPYRARATRLKRGSKRSALAALHCHCQDVAVPM